MSRSRFFLNRQGFRITFGIKIFMQRKNPIIMRLRGLFIFLENKKKY